MDYSRRLLILADDFTGACDAAAAFAASRSTLVVPEWPEQWPSDADQVEVLSVDLDLRERSPAEAEALTCEMAERQRAAHPQAYVFLKIDSTLRGPVGGLVAGALRGSARQVAVIAPAFPEQGRLLRDGHAVVDGRRGASLTRALGMRGTAVLGANVVRQSEDIEVAVAHARGRGARNVVVDADGSDCLRSVAEAWRGHANEWLLVGSAGLARQVADGANRVVGEIARGSGPVLVVAGSPAPATRSQIELLRGTGPQVVVGSETDLPRRPPGEAALLVICTLAAAERDSGERARLVAETTASWAAEFRPSALVLAGGATARLVCERLGARAVRLQGELQPGIPYGSLVAGIWDGLTVVTKAGGFGMPTTLLDVVRALGVSSIAELQP